jgi:hypothetical protein
MRIGHPYMLLVRQFVAFGWRVYEIADDLLDMGG